jgi:hypothetical protein
MIILFDEKERARYSFCRSEWFQILILDEGVIMFPLHWEKKDKFGVFATHQFFGCIRNGGIY